MQWIFYVNVYDFSESQFYHCSINRFEWMVQTSCAVWIVYKSVISACWAILLFKYATENGTPYTWVYLAREKLFYEISWKNIIHLLIDHNMNILGMKTKIMFVVFFLNFILTTTVYIVFIKMQSKSSINMKIVDSI